MPLTRDAQLDALLRLPWTVDVQTSDEGYLVARCVEIPGSLATGTDKELESAFWESLRESLACLLDAGDRIPLPEGVDRLPWEERRIVASRALLVEESRTASVGAYASEAAAA